MALRDEILANRRFPVSPPIDVPGWTGLNEPLHFRTLTSHDQDRLDEKSVRGSLAGLRGLFAALVLANADGTRVFADIDIPALCGMPHDPLSWIWDNGRAWNRIDEEAIEEMEGNSPAPDSGSGGGSPAPGATPIPTS